MRKNTIKQSLKIYPHQFSKIYVLTLPTDLHEKFKFYILPQLLLANKTTLKLLQKSVYLILINFF